MDIKQISVFLENKKGRLAEVTGILAREKINIRALSLADTAEFGILRLIVNDTDKAVNVLKANNFVAQKTDVLAVEVEDKPGGLARIMGLFDSNGINIEYMYAFVEKKLENAVVIFKIDDQKKAIEILKKECIGCLTNDILKSL
jgi:hypothetical protein